VALNRIHHVFHANESPAQIELKMHHKMDVDLINGPRPS